MTPLIPILALLLSLWVQAAHAQALAVPGAPTEDEATLTVSTTAVGLTCTRGTRALLRVNTNGIYYSLHGVAVTPDSGDFEAAAGTYLLVDALPLFRMVRSGAADASVKKQCFQ
jgi:hypothetical protein